MYRQHPSATKGQRLAAKNAIAFFHAQFAFRADMLFQGHNVTGRQRDLAQRRAVRLRFHLRRMNAAVEIPDLLFLKAENNLSMLFHRNIANRNGLKVPLPVFGSRFNRAQFYTLRRAGRHAEITAGAQIRHNGMHRARCAHNGVNRTRLNTFCAANAVGFVDNSKGTNRLRACSSPSTGWGSTFSRAAILSMTASPPGAQRLIFSPAPTASA